MNMIILMVCDTQRSITRQWIWANTLRTAVLLGHSANNNITLQKLQLEIHIDFFQYG